MLRGFWIITFLFLGALGWKNSQANTAEVPRSIQNAFSLFAVKEPFRHRLESIGLHTTNGKKSLTMNMWYEDASITRSGEPSDSLFCRISHTLIFGRHRERSNSRTLPLETAFTSIDGLEETRLNFFAVFYTNTPLPPTWAQKPVATAKDAADPNAKLRVIWSREEKVITYLSYAIQKGEWKTLSGLLKGSQNINFDEFQNTLCPNVLKLAPGLKANFKDVQNFIAESRSGATER